MNQSLKSTFLKGIIVLASASLGRAADLSPTNWPKAERERVETLESQTWTPMEAQTLEGNAGMVSATVSSIATYAGIQTLKNGGNAADAAVATALTQVTTQLGSVVSFAGLFTGLYYGARAKKVYSLDAGYNSYLNETDPMSIRACDLGTVTGLPARKSTGDGARGRETLVPGFMAGAEVLHHRFGRLPFRDLFDPAIWYAENGVRISYPLQSFFGLRGKYLSRTAEGRAFIRQSGSDTPRVGDNFVQAELAKTLKAISEHGSQYMYTGQWAGDFVRLVQREGGKVTPEDLKRYAPIWSEPRRETVFGHTIYVNGPPNTSAYPLFLGLNLAEALKLDEKGPYWTEAESFQTLARITQFALNAPRMTDPTTKFLSGKGIDVSPDAQLGKDFAQSVAPQLGRIYPPAAENLPKHSNAIVVIDKDGNIAVITHSINAVIWGDTGIVVDGIPLPDSAGFQQYTLAAIKPGDRVPHNIVDTIAFEGDNPVLATASIGSSLVPESIRVLLGVLGQHQTLASMMAAPPLLGTFDAGAANNGLAQPPISIPQGAYAPEFIKKLKALGVNLTEAPAATAAGVRGTLAAVVIDPKTGKRTAVNQPGVMVFGQVE